MDVDLSPDDLAFQEEVRDFLATNAHDPRADYGQWRIKWFELAKNKGGWGVLPWRLGPRWASELSAHFNILYKARTCNNKL